MDIQIAPELQQQLETLARERGMSVDALLRDLLRHAHHGEGENGTSAEQTCYELAAASGILGVVGDAPPDLSTNPDHLDGFGA
jgi:hypothetical protein